MKIGVFDSGIGGMTVLAELRRKLPSLDYFYFGDTAHVPYGSKSPAQIQRLALNCVQTLKEKEIDALVVACNTATSLALPAIREVMGLLPVFGVIEPGIEAALKLMKSEDRNSLLVLATQATVNSRAYSKALNEKRQNCSFTVVEQACPLLVPMIEEGWIDHSILHQTVEEYVGSHRKNHPGGIALLGCTHYPWIHSAFERALPGWKVINSASAIVTALQSSPFFQQAMQRWPKERLSLFNQPPPDGGGEEDSKIGQIEWLFTDADAVPAFAKVQMNLLDNYAPTTRLQNSHFSELLEPTM